MSSLSNIILKSSDGERERFEIQEAVAVQSQTIKKIEDNIVKKAIPLPSVTGSILGKVIEYCKKHSDEIEEDHLKSWDTEFVKFVDSPTLFDLVLAANYLNIKSPLDLTCKMLGHGSFLGTFQSLLNQRPKPAQRKCKALFPDFSSNA